MQRSTEPGRKRFFRWFIIADIVEAILLAVDAIFPRKAPVTEKKELPAGERVAAEQLFTPRANTIFRSAIAAAVLLLVVILVAIDLMPRTSSVTGVNGFVRQPLPFSHEHHVGEIGIDCRFCHQFVAQSSFAGIPQTQTCMKCHRVLFKDAPMLAPVRESFATGKPLSWNRVYALPDFVYFDHGIHVSKGVSCQTCHGDLGRMPWVRRAYAFFMGQCLGCHRKAGLYVKPVRASVLKGLTECSTCHR